MYSTKDCPLLRGDANIQKEKNYAKISKSCSFKS